MLYHNFAPYIKNGHQFPGKRKGRAEKKGNEQTTQEVKLDHCRRFSEMMPDGF
jgi:hypothetical protein